MGYKESERRNDEKWIREKLKKIEMLEEQEKSEKKYSKKIEILRQVEEIYKDLDMEGELENKKAIADYESVKEKIRYYESMYYYYQTNRIKCYNLDTGKIEEIGGREDWEEEIEKSNGKEDLKEKNKKISESEDLEEER